MSPMSPRLLRPRATGFSPKQIANLSAWWDASDSATLFDATSGGSLVAANGAVARWEDKSGNARHMTQATVANRPVRTIAALNGRDCLTADSTDVLTGSHRVFTDQVSVFAVTRVNNAALRAAAFDFGDYSTTGSFYAERNTFQTAGSRWGLYTARSVGGSTYDTTIPTSTLPEILSLVCNAVSGTSILTSTDFRINGNPSGALTRKQGADDLWPNYAAQTAAISIVVGTPLVCEMLVYNRTLSAAERQKVEGYLAWKWGLQASLPYDHPYAASFPGYAPQTMPSDADALAYLSAVRTADGGTGVEVGVANAVDGFVKGCKSDGIWSAIKASCILAGARTLSGALVPLAGTAPTNNGPFVAADYNRKTGLLGDGSTKYIDTTRNRTSDGQDDSHAAAFVTSAATLNYARLLGAGSSTGMSSIVRDANATGIIVTHNNTTESFANTGGVVNFAGISRSSSASYTYRINSTTGSVTLTSQASPSLNWFVFNRNPNSTFFNGRVSFYSIGSALDLAKLDTRVSRLINEAQYTLNTGLSGSSYATETLTYINAGYAAGGTLA